MEYEEDEEEEREGEIGLGPSYDDSLPNSTRPPPLKLNSQSDSEPSPQPLFRRSRYKECLKNHAVGIGGHATDGCGEFIAAGEDGTLESLKCAACSCHRNFHRKDPAADGGGGGPTFFPFPQHHHQQQQQQQLLMTHHGYFGHRTPGGYIQQRAALLALPSSSGGGGGGSREDGEEYNYYYNPGSGSQKKRFRTKFSQEQKEKMLNLAERLGWKIQKEDEELVQHLCNELSIKRQVFKVWMHNNKLTLGKKT